MKKLFYLLLLFIPVLSFGQAGVVNQGAVGSNVKWLNNIGFSGYMKLPMTNGTPGAVAGSYLMGKNGLVAYDSTNKITYVNNGTTWVAISGGTSLPTQTGNSGKFLTTNGTTASWATVAGGGGSGSYPTEKVGNVYYLSKMGAVSNANFATYSPGTDNTTIVRAAMDSAALHPNSMIVFDGAYGTQPFKVPSYTTIYAPNRNCGAVEIATSSQWSLIGNLHDSLSFYDTTHPILDEGIVINGGSWVAPTGYSPIQFDGIRYCSFINLNVRSQAAGFAFTVYEANHLIFQNFEIFSGLDGIHFNGKVSDVIIRDGQLQTGDDGIAINADDIWACCGNSSSIYYPFLKSLEGGMHDFHIDNIHFNGGNYGIRMLSSKSPIDNIFINDLHGFLTVYGINISNYTPDATLVPGYSNGRVGTVVISNMHVNITTYNGGGENNSPIYIAVNCRNIILNNITIDSINQAAPIISVTNSIPMAVERLTIDGLRSRDTNSTDPRPFIFIQRSGTRIKNLILRNIFIDRSGASTIFSPAVSGYYGSIDNILIDGYTQLNSYPFINTGSAAFGADPAGIINVGRITANNIFMDKTGTSGFVKAEHILPILTLSNFDGQLSDSGFIGVKNGDAFTNKEVPPVISGSPILPSVPQAYYNFTETGTTFTDKIGSNTLTKSSNALTGVGKFGSGVYFPTTSALLTGPSSTSLSLEGGGNQGVIFCYFKIDPSNTGTVRIFGKGTSGANNLEYELLYDASAHQMILHTSFDGTGTNISTLTWSYTTTGEWTYVALEFIGVSGGSVIRYTPSGTSYMSHGYQTYSSTGAFTVGGFVGSIDEMLITRNTNNGQSLDLSSLLNYNFSPFQPQVSSIPLEFANDTEAAAAGVALGGEYRTGSALKRRVQ